MIYDCYPTKLLKNIRNIASHPDIFPFMLPVSVENLPPLHLNAILKPELTVYMLRINYKQAGLGFFTKKENEAIVDVCFLPNYRGKDAKVVAMLAIEDYISKNKVSALIGKIRKSNPRSLIFSKWCMFHMEHEDEQFYYVRRCHG